MTLTHFHGFANTLLVKGELQAPPEAEIERFGPVSVCEGDREAQPLSQQTQCL